MANLVLTAGVLGLGGAVLGSGTPESRQPALFVMLYTPGPAWDTLVPPSAQPHFGAHSANLARLRRDSVIVMGGRFGPWGLILFEAEDLAAARAEFEPDSSLQSGTFTGEVHPWTTIFAGMIPPR